VPTVSPIIVTSDLERLRTFYTELLGATVAERVPEEGPVFFVGLRLGDSHLGLVSDADVSPGAPTRVVLSIDVPDVEALLPRVTALGGRAGSGANDMPWGQRVAHIKDPDGNVVNLTQQL
jgi:predicted enzyme related to lactoylglutathione lyase